MLNVYLEIYSKVYRKNVPKGATNYYFIAISRVFD